MLKSINKTVSSEITKDVVFFVLQRHMLSNLGVF